MLFRKMRKEFLPLFRPVMDDEEIKEVTAILKSGWLTTGPKTREFEERFAAYSGAKHGIGVINCTTALFMCLEAAKMENPEGSEVITTPLTWCSSATVIENAGMKTVFADVNKRTGSAYAYFGGYEGDGDITKKIVLPEGISSIDSAYMELDAGSEFDLYINGILSGHYIPSAGAGADEWVINSSYFGNFDGGNNTVLLMFA